MGANISLKLQLDELPKQSSVRVLITDTYFKKMLAYDSSSSILPVKGVQKSLEVVVR